MQKRLFYYSVIDEINHKNRRMEMDDENSNGGSEKTTHVFMIEPFQNNFFCPHCLKSISKFQTAATHSLYQNSSKLSMTSRCRYVNKETTKKDSFDGMIPVISYENNDVQFKCAICERLDKQGQDKMFKKVKQRQRNGTQKNTYNLQGLLSHMKKHHQEYFIETSKESNMDNITENGVAKTQKVCKEINCNEETNQNHLGTSKKSNSDNTKGNGDAKNQNGGNEIIRNRHDDTKSDDDTINGNEKMEETNQKNSTIRSSLRQSRRIRNRNLKCTQASCENEYCESGILKHLKVCPACALKHFEKKLDEVKFVFDGSQLLKAGDKIYGLFMKGEKKKRKKFKWYPGKVLEVPVDEGLITINVEWDDSDDAKINQIEKGWSFEWFVDNKVSF